MNINIFLAFLAGLISFLSPCIFPVIPSYLSYISGLSISDISDKKNNRWNLLLNSILFVFGFTIIFILMGVFFSSIGVALSGVATYINMAAGVIVILLGLNFIFNFWKILNLEKKIHFKHRPSGKPGSILLGMAFGAGWTPCIGPILASILFVAGSSGSVYRGAALLFAFSSGLGVPFILAGLFFSFFQKTMVKVRPHLNRIKIGSGLFLIVIGILIFTGQLSKMNIILYTFANKLHNWEISHIIEARAVYGSLFLIPAIFTAIAIRKSFILKKVVTLKSSFLTFRTALFSGLLIIAVLIYTGIFEIGGLIQKWLTFQGI